MMYSENVLREASTLRNSHLLKQLEAIRQEALEYAGTQSVDAVLYRFQGRAQLAGELIAMINGAHAELERRSHPMPKMQKAF